MFRTANTRLNAVLHELNEGDKVADIGCDHGIVANLAVEITKNPVFATDISAPSLHKAMQLAETCGNDDRLICRLGDGLEPVANEDIDTVVIAGMGGHEIIRILSRATRRYKKYILVPHRDAKRLREYLVENDYSVIKDTAIISEGKYYWVIVCGGEGGAIYSSFELYFGKTENDERRKFIENRLDYLKKLLPQTNGERRREIDEEIKLIEDWYEN